MTWGGGKPGEWPGAPNGEQERVAGKGYDSQLVAYSTTDVLLYNTSKTDMQLWWAKI